MRGILYLLPLGIFCLGWSSGPASHLSQFHAPLSLRPEAAASAARLPNAGIRAAFTHSSQAPPATATPPPQPSPSNQTGPEEAPLAQAAADDSPADWRAFDHTTHGLTIFYPPRWLFFDAAQELTLPERMAAPVRAAAMSLLMRLQSSTPQPGSFVGYGFASPQEPPELLHVNSVVVDIFPLRGLTLYQFGQTAAARLGRQVGIDVDSFDLVTRLRPDREEAISIRFRGAVPVPAASRSVLTGARTAGWQVILLSPQAEFALVLTFTTLGEQFDELEPLLTEMARRVRWTNASREPEPAVAPVTIANRTMQVQAQPVPSSPIIGKVMAGRQFSIIERDVTGNWWRISYDGQPGWVSDHLAVANAPQAPLAVPVAMIERRVNVRSGPGASNPVTGVAIPGQQYLITGKSLSGDWWKIDDNGRPGWIFSELVTALDAEGVQVAVVKFPLPPLLPVSEAMMTVNRGINVRGGPDSSYPVTGAAVPGRQYPITGKNAAGNWWRIDDDGRPGWVFGELVTPVNAGSVQVVARFPLPPLLPATEAVLTFSRRMNVYGGPGARYPVIDTTVPGRRYPVIGRNAVGSWWQIDNQGQSGWVFGQLARTVAETEEG